MVNALVSQSLQTPDFDCKSASSDRVSSGCLSRHRSHRHGPLNVRTLGCQAGGRGLGSRRSRHFRIADLPCQSRSPKIFSGCRPQRQVATVDLSLKPSRLPIANRNKRASEHFRVADNLSGTIWNLGHHFPHRRFLPVTGSSTRLQRLQLTRKDGGHMVLR